MIVVNTVCRYEGRPYIDNLKYIIKTFLCKYKNAV